MARARTFALRALSATPMATVVRVGTPEPVAAITFDDGPDALWTPQVLDVLEAHGALGTFFVIGKYVESHDKIMHRMAGAGHAIGNHSWDHPCFPLISSKERRRQVLACAAALEPYTSGPRLFRPPYLDQTVASSFDVWRLGHQVIAASLHADDWEEHDANYILQRLNAGLGHGEIVMLHDVIRDRQTSGRKAMIQALDMFLSRWRQTYRFVTIPELLRTGRPMRQMWVKRPTTSRRLRLTGGL